MLRPLIGAATALLFLATLAYAQPRLGRPPGPPPALPPVPQIQNPPLQNQFQPNRGFQWNQNRNWNNWNQNRVWIDAPFATRTFYPYGGFNSVWYTPFARWNVPLSGRAGFSVLYAPAQYAVPEVVATMPAELAGQEHGMYVTEVFDHGTAWEANLRAGDIIVGVDQKRTQSFESLQLALLGNTEAEIVFINHDNGRIEKMPVKVENGKIGVAVVPIAL